MDSKELEEIKGAIEEVNSNVDWVRINTGNSDEKLDKVISLLEKLVEQGK